MHCLPAHMAEFSPPAAELPLASLSRDHPAQIFAALPARDLVKLVQRTDENPHAPATQAILTAFYYRYGPYLVTVVAHKLGPLCDRSGLQEVVHDAFLEFFQKSRRFDADLAPDDAACDQNLRAYLAQLANWKASDARAFQQSLGAHAVDGETLDGYANASLRAGAPDSVRTEPPAEYTERVRQVAEWIGSLREIEAEVLRTYFLDDHLGQKSDRLPEGIAQQLAAKFGVTTSNIRHIKLKLLRQLRERFGTPAQDSHVQP